MAEYQQEHQRPQYSPTPITQEHPVDAPEVRVDGTEIDSLLDEIDEVLEENAQEFVADYVQQGGQ